MRNTTVDALLARAGDVSARAVGMIAHAGATRRASRSAGVIARHPSDYRAFLSHHGSDRLMADTELISEGAQAFGRGKRSNSEEMIGVGEGPEDGKATSI